MFSRFAGFACQQIAEDLRHGGREKDMDAISSKLTAPQKRLFEKLRVAEEYFENARTDNEIDMNRAFPQTFVQQDLGQLREQFLINLQRFSKGDVPKATLGDVGSLDARLNAEYQRIMRSPSSTFEDTTIKPEGIRATQRAWVPLRDAWVELAKSAYPKLSTDRVTAQIIRLRLDQLRKLP